MKAIFSIFLMVALSGLALSGQAPEKRFVGNCSFSGFALLSDSTYRGDIVNFTDRFGDGYNLNQLAAGYEILDGRGLVFEVDTIHSATNFTADVSVTAKVDRGFAPFGSGQAYSPTENGLIPPSSQEQAGLSPTQKARVDRHNVVVMQSLIGGRDSVYSIASVPDTSGLSPVLGDAFVNATADTLGLYDGAGWVLFFGGSQSADGFTILGDGTGGDPFRVNTDSLHTKMVSMDGPLIHYLNPCEANIDLSLSGTLFYDSIRIGDNLSGLITEDDEVPFVVVGITEWPGYATFTLFASNVVPGVYFPGIYYAGELLWSDQVTVVAGSTDTVTVFDPPGQDSILVTRVCGTEISRDTIPLADVLPSDNVTGTGTTNRIPLWAGVQELGDSYLLQSADALTLDASKVFQFAGHTTAGRPTATLGFSGYNTTTNWFEGSNGTSWWYFPRTSLAGGLFTPGSVPFAGDDGSLAEDNANLFFNNTNNRLGVGTNSPIGSLDIQTNINNINLAAMASGVISFGDGGSGDVPTMVGKTTSSGVGLLFMAGSSNANTIGDLILNIREHDNTDFADLTQPGFKLTRFSTDLVRILRNGNTGIGVTAPTARLHLTAGTATAGTAPLGFTSGPLLTTPEVGKVEFLTDRWYGTITTGAARKGFAFTDDITAITTGLATNDVPRWDGSAFQPSGITSDGTDLFAVMPGEAGLESTDNFTITSSGGDVDITASAGATLEGTNDFARLVSGGVSVVADGFNNAVLIGDAIGANTVLTVDEGNGNITAAAPTGVIVLGDHSSSAGETGIQIDDSNTEILIGHLTEAGNSTIKTTETDINMYGPQGVFIAADDEAIVLGDVLQNGVGTVLWMNPTNGGLSVQPWVGHDVTDPSFSLSQIYDGSTGGVARFDNMSVSMSGLNQNGEVGGNLLYYIGFETTNALEKTRTSNSYAAFWEEGVREYALFPTADTITIDTFDFAQRNDAAIDIMVDSIGLSGGIIVNQKSEAAYWKVDYGFFVDSDEDQIYTFWDVTTDGSEAPERLEGSASRSEISAVAGINHAGRSFIVRVPSGQGIRLCAYGNPGVTASMDISFLSITVTQVTAP